MALVQIQGGGFQNLQGEVLVNGYLVLELSHDEQDSSPTPTTQVLGGLRKTIQLDMTGNIPSSPAVKIHANSTLLPAGSFYTVMAFQQNGTQAWRSPQYWIIPNTDPYNVGNIIPTNPPASGSSGGGSTLLLQVEGVNNASQSVLNLVDVNVTSNPFDCVSFVDNGAGAVSGQLLTFNGTGTFGGAGGTLNFTLDFPYVLATDYTVFVSYVNPTVAPGILSVEYVDNGHFKIHSSSATDASTIRYRVL